MNQACVKKIVIDSIDRAKANISNIPFVYNNNTLNIFIEIDILLKEELRSLLHPIKKDIKAHYREYTLPARQVCLEKHKTWLDTNWTKYFSIFAKCFEINPIKIKPRLELVENQEQRNIFRIARLYWSLPHTYGYGRRLNYLIWDDSNSKLIGILGLQSPPISLPARDKYYQIPYDQKIELVNQTMDAFTVGALPPYNDLLAGKLVVLAAASQEVRKDYAHRYKNKKTEMLNRVLPADLIAITTLSAFGKSSMYNRVSQGKNSQKNIWATISLGVCQGWGTLHFSDTLYGKMKELHKQLYPDKPVRGFGTGPKIRFQITNRILNCLNLSQNLLKHNIKREVFIIPHVENVDEILAGKPTKPIYNDRPFVELAEYWKERYCIPRSEKRCSIEGRHTIAKELQQRDCTS